MVNAWGFFEPISLSCGTLRSYVRFSLEIDFFLNIFKINLVFLQDMEFSDVYRFNLKIKFEKNIFLN